MAAADAEADDVDGLNNGLEDEPKVGELAEAFPTVEELAVANDGDDGFGEARLAEGAAVAANVPGEDTVVALERELLTEDKPPPPFMVACN